MRGRRLPPIKLPFDLDELLQQKGEAIGLSAHSEDSLLPSQCADVNCDPSLYTIVRVTKWASFRVAARVFSLILPASCRHFQVSSTDSTQNGPTR